MVFVVQHTIRVRIQKTEAAVKKESSRSSQAMQEPGVKRKTAMPSALPLHAAHNFFDLPFIKYYH